MHGTEEDGIMRTFSQIIGDRNFATPDDAINWALKAYDGPIAPDRGPYSFSSMNGCLLSFYWSKVDKQKRIRPRRFGTPEGSAVHECFDQIGKAYMRGEQPSALDTARVVASQNPEWGPMEDILEDRSSLFMDKFDFDLDSVVGVEVEVAMNLRGEAVDYDAEDAWFRGKIDYLGLDSDLMLHMIDYKNYPSIHSDDALRSTASGVGAQLMGYAVLARASLGRNNIAGAYRRVYYSRFGVTRSVRYKPQGGTWQDKIDTNEEMDAFWKKLRRRMFTLERLHKDAFIPQPSAGQCQYCNFVHKCPAIQSDGEPVITTQQQAEDLAGEIVVLNERMTRGKTLLKQWAAEVSPVKTDGASVSYEAYNKETYDVEEMIKSLRQQWGPEFWTRFLSQVKLTAASQRDLYASLEKKGDVLKVETKTKLKSRFDL